MVGNSYLIAIMEGLSVIRPTSMLTAYRKPTSGPSKQNRSGVDGPNQGVSPAAEQVENVTLEPKLLGLRIIRRRILVCKPFCKTSATLSGSCAMLLHLR